MEISSGSARLNKSSVWPEVIAEEGLVLLGTKQPHIRQRSCVDLWLMLWNRTEQHDNERFIYISIKYEYLQSCFWPEYYRRMYGVFCLTDVCSCSFSFYVWFIFRKSPRWLSADLSSVHVHHWPLPSTSRTISLSYSSTLIISAAAFTLILWVFKWKQSCLNIICISN